MLLSSDSTERPAAALTAVRPSWVRVGSSRNCLMWRGTLVLGFMARLVLPQAAQ